VTLSALKCASDGGIVGLCEVHAAAASSTAPARAPAAVRGSPEGRHAMMRCIAAKFVSRSFLMFSSLF
jgi:hypothetical protein